MLSSLWYQFRFDALADIWHYLINHPVLAKRYKSDRVKYTKIKTEFIQQVAEKAMHKMRKSFPEIIKALPEADIPVDGVSAYISRGDLHQILFMEFENDIEIPEHSHGAQWGIVVTGEIELTIDGKKKIIQKRRQA